jgi:chromosome segregation ATPase
MNRLLGIINLAGVVILAAVCLVQWRVDHGLNMKVQGLEAQSRAQADKIADQEKALAGTAADLEDFRARVTRSNEAFAEAQTKLKGAGALQDQTARERDHYKATAAALQESLDKWIAAVAARDETIKQSEAQVQRLSTERNEAVVKFNELAAKYNAGVDDLKRAAEQIQKVVADRNDAVKRFNELAEKYNELVKGAHPPETSR